MIQKFKLPLIVTCAIALSGWIGYSVFQYATHQDSPHVFIAGLRHENSYKGTVSCALTAHNGYKIDSVNVYLDDHAFDFGASPSVRAKDFSLPFSLNTTTLADGKHSFKIESRDSSYNQNRGEDVIDFYVDNTSLKAAFSQNNYKVDQGKTIHVTIQTNKKLKEAKINFLSKEYDCYQTSPTSHSYESFIPIECEDHPGQYDLSCNVKDSVGNTITLNTQAEIKSFKFKKQTGKGIASQEKLDQEKEVSLNQKILFDAIDKWMEKSPKKKLWNGPFVMPITVQRMTTPHGEIRTTPERGRYMHMGVDLVNLPRSVVWASQHGKVIIKDRFLISGNTVVIDHGLGVCTLYGHLDSYADIEVGDMIRKGNPIGKIGMTGYASGYHLHWEIRVNNVAVDPLEWTKNIY